MNKKITMTSLEMNLDAGTILYVTIDNLRFSADEDQFSLVVEIENKGKFELIEEIDLGGPDAEIIIDHNDLKRVALNWIFKNVEIVKEL